MDLTTPERYSAYLGRFPSQFGKTVESAYSEVDQAASLKSGPGSQVFGDQIFDAPVIHAAKHLSSSVPVYVYRIEIGRKLTLLTLYCINTSLIGAASRLTQGLEQFGCALWD